MPVLSADKPVPVWFIPLFALLVWGGQYALRDLWEPDEARYAYVAREMEQTGSMMIPVRNGEAYTHKPPLMFWLIRAGTLLTGGEYNGISARFPTFLGVLLSLWAVSRLCLIWFDPWEAPKIAWRAFFILTTSILFWQKAGMGQIDILLLGLEFSALYLLFKNDETPAPWRPVAAFLLMGFAILAKGPVGLIVPVGIYVAANGVSGQARWLRKSYWLWGIPLALLPPAAWLLGMKFSGASSEFFNELLFTQNVGRTTGEFGGHVRPIYYYLKYVILDFIPWIFFIPASVLVLKNDAARRKHLNMLLGWMGFVLVFFSLCATKRNLYILSVYPAAAIMVAAAWPRFRWMAEKWSRISFYPIAVIMAIGAIAGLGGFVMADRFPVGWSINGTVFLPFGLVLATGVFLLLKRYRKAGLDQGWFNRFAVVFLLAELCVGVMIYPAFNLMKTPGLLAAEVQAYLAPSQRLLLYGINGEIFALYANRQGLRFDDMTSMSVEMERQEKGIVVFMEKQRPEIEKRFSHIGMVRCFTMGDKDVCFLTFDFGVKQSNKEPPAAVEGFRSRT